MISSDNHKENIGLRIKAARSALGLTQKKLCERAGMKLPSLRDYELCKRIPGGEAVAAFAYVGINANWLLTGEGPMMISELVGEAAQDLRDAASLQRILDDVRAGRRSVSDLLQAMEPAACYGDPDKTGDSADMLSISRAGADAVPGSSIDEYILMACHAACKRVYGETFSGLGVVLQMGYAADLYNLLVKINTDSGKEFDQMRRLESDGLVDLLNVFIRLGWARKFPPTAEGLFF